MTWIVVAAVALLLAAVPALVFRVNLRFYTPPPHPDPRPEPKPAVSVLIPARNEERSIVAAVEAALASRGVELEVVVLATCRMYRGAGELWSGLARNATEGLAAPTMLLTATALLLGGQVLPFVLLACAPRLPPAALALSLLAVGAAYYPHLAGARHFGQSWFGAHLHPLGILILLAIQWFAAGRALLGRPAGWKGRAYREPDRRESDLRERPVGVRPDAS